LSADVQSVEKADGYTKQINITYEGIYFPFKGEVRQDVKLPKQLTYPTKQ